MSDTINQDMQDMNDALRLETACIRLGLTVDQMAYVCCVDKKTVVRWRRGDNPVPSHVKGLLVGWLKDRTSLDRSLSRLAEMSWWGVRDKGVPRGRHASNRTKA